MGHRIDPCHAPGHLGGEQVRGPAAGFSAAAGSGLLLFMAAERLAPCFRLWEPVGVAEVAGVAVYVPLPELALCLASFGSWCAGPERVRWR